MTILSHRSRILLILGVLFAATFARTSPINAVPWQASPVTIIPLQSDDGLDPVTLIFTGYAPSWWVAANVAGWSDSAYCSGPKTINGSPYNYTLEHPDPMGVSCIGPRDHIRIWDMGYSPIFGVWSIGSAHHEHTDYLPLPHHVIDNWTRAEADVRSAFLNGQATVSISNYTLSNAGFFQGIFNTGNATMIQLKSPQSHYPVVFSETGLGNRTSWSATLNGLTVSSTKPDIVFDEPNGTYPFTIGSPTGFNVSPSSGTLTVSGVTVIQNVLFRTPWATSTVLVDTAGQHVQIRFNSNATVLTSTVKLSKTGDTSLNFNVTEVGPTGVVNVTLPKSILPTGASPKFYLDGISNSNVETTMSSDSFYIYVTLPYGTHAVELRFASSEIPLLEFVAGGALAVTIVSGLAFVFRFKLKRKTDRTLDLPST